MVRQPRIVMAEATPASDIRFAQFAVKMKFVSPDQVRECVLLQRRYIVRDSANFPNLARIMVAKNFLAKHQARAVLEQVRQYELEQAMGGSGPEETNVLSEEQAEVITEMAPVPPDKAPSPPHAPSGDPEQISGYRILEKIGAGSMGTVYRARQESMDRLVALKVLPAAMTRNRRFVEQFLSEARAAGRLNHPNVIRVHDVGREDDVYFYSMEFVEGKSLDALIASEGALPVNRALQIMMQTAQALDYGHKQEIVHREVRPEAIMVGAEDQTKLADLGLTCIGTDRMSVNRCLNQVVQFAEKEREAELIDVQMEFL